MDAKEARRLLDEKIAEANTVPPERAEQIRAQVRERATFEVVTGKITEAIRIKENKALVFVFHTTSPKKWPSAWYPPVHGDSPEALVAVDEAETIANSWRERDYRVEVIHSRNSGPGDLHDRRTDHDVFLKILW